MQGHHLPAGSRSSDAGAHLFDAAGDGVDTLPAPIGAENLGRALRVGVPGADGVPTTAGWLAGTAIWFTTLKSYTFWFWSVPLVVVRLSSFTVELTDAAVTADAVIARTAVIRALM